MAVANATTKASEDDDGENNENKEPDHCLDSVDEVVVATTIDF